MSIDLSGKSIVELSADLAAGYITSNMIKDQLGPGILSSVISFGGGIAAGVLANKALEMINDETGIIDDLGEVVDDFFSIF